MIRSENSTRGNALKVRNYKQKIWKMNPKFFYYCMCLFKMRLSNSPNLSKTPKLRHIEFETLSIYLKITLVKIKISKKIFLINIPKFKRNLNI